jgi:uncharacterized protein
VLQTAWRREAPFHGDEHWRAVTATGLDLADRHPKADRHLVFLFGLLHDTRRVDDGPDPEHGRRAAALAIELRDVGRLKIGRRRLERLCKALALHADGHTSGNKTIGVCWDADRLHLPRVGILPSPELLSTRAGREPGALELASAIRETPPTWAELATML